MRKTFKKFRAIRSLLFFLLWFTSFSCHEGQTNVKDVSEDTVALNIKMYSAVWNEIINNRKLDKFNDSSFTRGVIMHASPADLVGIDSARAYYANYLTGFSGIAFTIKDIFGMDNKLVKHWNFKGTHTGLFFGIPATNKRVDIDGVTLVRMENGKIAEERDFLDNLEFSNSSGSSRDRKAWNMAKPI